MIKFKTLKTSFITILLFFVWTFSNAQTETRYGKAYRNVVDFRNDKPLYVAKFRYLLNTSCSYDIYEVKADHIRLSKKEIKYGIWLISDGDFLYFNAGRHGFKPGYVKLRKGGNYYYFYSEPTLSVSQRKRILNSGYQYGTIGSIVSASKVNKENIRFQHNVLDLKKGTSDILTIQYIQKVLKPYSDLLKEFNENENKSDLKVLRMYLIKINERIVLDNQ